MSMEQALIFLREFVNKDPYFYSTRFLLDSLANERISNALIKELGLLFRANTISRDMTRKLETPKRINEKDLVRKIKFIKGNLPGNIRIKLIT